jgi:hypothetical protein
VCCAAYRPGRTDDGGAATLRGSAAGRLDSRPRRSAGTLDTMVLRVVVAEDNLLVRDLWQQYNT